MVVMMMIFNVC